MSWRSTIKTYFTKTILDSVAAGIGRTGISPDTLTVLGFLLSVLAAYLVSQGIFVAGGMALLSSGLFDLLDGAVARARGQASPRGALLDSSLDRFGEGVLFFGLLWFYVQENSPVESLMVYLAFFTSIMVSYLRARSESVGIKGDVGVLTRGERIIALTAGLLANHVPLALGIIIILATFTTGQRLIHGLRNARRLE